jgi:hypothetical protein
MQREIKFRIIHKDKIVGYEHLTKTGWKCNWIELNPNKGERWCTGVVEDSTSIAMLREQFTGVTDKFNKEIYVGDILKEMNRSKITKKDYWFPVYVVEIDKFGFTLKHVGGGKSNGSWYLPLTNWGTIVKIGDVHENPELIPSAVV